VPLEFSSVKDIGRDSLGNIVVAVRFPVEPRSSLGLLPINWTIDCSNKWHVYVDFEPCSIPETTTTTTATTTTTTTTTTAATTTTRPI
jgi:hypothetical protein